MSLFQQTYSCVVKSNSQHTKRLVCVGTNTRPLMRLGVLGNRSCKSFARNILRSFYR